MVKFNLLTISANGKNLIVDASVIDLPVFTNIFIKRVSIQKGFSEIPKSDAWVREYARDAEVKNIHIETQWEDTFLLSPEKGIFYVFIECYNNEEIDIPCSLNKTAIGATFNECPIRSLMMNSIKELKGRCELPKHFIDVFLSYKAIELAICLQHFEEAEDFYDRLILNKLNCGSAITTTKTCNCHG